jgi:AcrR family transcriptional regulator
MLVVVSDPSADLVTDAMRRLGEQEGRPVTIAALARHAGLSKSNLYYHLGNRRQYDRRQVPAELVEALAAVLPVSQADPARAAQVSAGYQVRENSDELPDMRGTVVRYLNSAPDRDARLAVLVELQRITIEEMRRELASQDDDCIR